MKRGRFQGACLSIILSIAVPDDGLSQVKELYFGPAFESLAAGEFDEARLLFEEGFRFEPDDPQANYFYAKALEGLGSTEDAIAAYRRAHELAPLTVEGAEAFKRAAELSKLIAEKVKAAAAAESEEAGKLARYRPGVISALSRFADTCYSGWYGIENVDETACVCFGDFQAGDEPSSDSLELSVDSVGVDGAREFRVRMTFVGSPDPDPEPKITTWMIIKLGEKVQITDDSFYERAGGLGVAQGEEAGSFLPGVRLMIPFAPDQSPGYGRGNSAFHIMDGPLPSCP